MTPSHAPGRLVTPRFALVVGAGLAYFTALGMLLPVVPVYVEKRLDGGGLAVGVAVGAMFVSAVICRPLAGRVGDRFGRRVLLIGGASIVAVSIALYGSAESFPVLVAARLLSGVGEAAFFVGGATMVTDLAPAARRRRSDQLLVGRSVRWIGPGPADRRGHPRIEPVHVGVVRRGRRSPGSPRCSRWARATPNATRTRPCTPS